LRPKVDQPVTVVGWLTFALIRPHHPDMDRRRFLLASLAGALAAPRAADALHHVAGLHCHDACRRQGAFSGSRSPYIAPGGAP
jgi:hypothetical protein